MPNGWGSPRLREIRKSLDISIKDLAKKSKLAEEFLVTIESGKRSATKAEAIKIVNAINSLSGAKLGLENIFGHGYKRRKDDDRRGGRGRF